MRAAGGAPRAHIMAAGLGTRLAPLTDRTAKPMAPIVNRPVMEHILRLLARHGVTEVCVNLHHYADDIRGYFGDGATFGVRAHYSFEEKLLGTAGGTGGFRELLGGGTFVVVSGDALTDVDISAFVAAHRRRGAIATIAVKEVDDPSHYGVVVHDDAGRVTGFQEKPATGEALSRPVQLRHLRLRAGDLRLHPAGSVRRLRQRRLSARCWPTTSLSTYGGSRPTGTTSAASAQYRRGNFDALLGRVAVTLPGRELRLGVWVGEGTEVAGDVEIVPPVLIGDGCRVGAQAKLVGPLVIGDGCTIGQRRRPRGRHPLERHRPPGAARRWPAASSAAPCASASTPPCTAARSSATAASSPTAPSSRPTPGWVRRPRWRPRRAPPEPRA